MSERIVEAAPTEAPELDETRKSLVITALAEARTQMEEGKVLVPVTYLVVNDKLLIENHPGETTDECIEDARRTVEGARGALAYALCFDGYVNTNLGKQDAVIVEVAQPGDETGLAFGLIYDTKEDGTVEFKGDPSYIAPAPNYMADLVDGFDGDDGFEDEEYEEEDEASDNG